MTPKNIEEVSGKGEGTSDGHRPTDRPLLSAEKATDASSRFLSRGVDHLRSQATAPGPEGWIKSRFDAPSPAKVSAF